jgi:HEAT repeat protein
MKISKAVISLAFAACLHAQAPVDKAWSLLSDAAKDNSHETRHKAITALGIVSGNARAESMAVAALKDENEDVRAAAADALGQMHATGSAEQLKAAVRDPATAVVFSAANSLFLIGDPAAYEVYYAVLTGQRKSGDALIESQLKMLKDPKALTKLGFEAGVGFIPFGGVALTAFKMVKADTMTPVRASAALKLAGDPDPKVAQALTAATKDEKWLVRATVAGAIARRNDPSLLSAVAQLLNDENDIVRMNAAAAVIHLTK